MTEAKPYAWDHPAPHILPVTVQPQHIDVMQHTNNVVYLQWVDAVAWSHSRSAGLGPDEYAAAGYGMVVREHRLEYLGATRLGDEVLLGTWLTEVDRLSTWRCYQFIRAADGQTVFRGSSHFVCVEIAGGRVRRMPPAFFEAYAAAARLQGLSVPAGPAPSAARVP